MMIVVLVLFFQKSMKSEKFAVRFGEAGTSTQPFVIQYYCVWGAAIFDDGIERVVPASADRGRSWSAPYA